MYLRKEAVARSHVLQLPLGCCSCLGSGGILPVHFWLWVPFPLARIDTDVIWNVPFVPVTAYCQLKITSQLCNCFALNFHVRSPGPFCQVLVRTCWSESLSRWSSACGRRSPHHCHTYFRGLGICYCRAHLRDREKGNIIIVWLEQGCFEKSLRNRNQEG